MILCDEVGGGDGTAVGASDDGAYGDWGGGGMLLYKLRGGVEWGIVVGGGGRDCNNRLCGWCASR